MLNHKERRYALYGAILLLIHTATAAVAAAVWLAAWNTAWFHLGSAICYLSGFLCYYLCFRRRNPILSSLFAVFITVGILFGLVVKLVSSGMSESHPALDQQVPILQEATPVAFLFLAAILLRCPAVLKVIGGFFGLGAVCWLIADNVTASPPVDNAVQFGAELFGMNAVLALVIWSFVMVKAGADQPS